MPASASRLDSGDVFILDMGLTIYQWNGTGASIFEKNKVNIISDNIAIFNNICLRIQGNEGNWRRTNE